jgi:hypothetical protein
MSLPNKGREPGQRQARISFSHPTQIDGFSSLRESFPERLSRKIRCNCSIEIPLKSDQRQRMPLPEAQRICWSRAPMKSFNRTWNTPSRILTPLSRGDELEALAGVRELKPWMKM